MKLFNRKKDMISGLEAEVSALRQVIRSRDIELIIKSGTIKCLERKIKFLEGKG